MCKAVVAQVKEDLLQIEEKVALTPPQGTSQEDWRDMPDEEKKELMLLERVSSFTSSFKAAIADASQQEKIWEHNDKGEIIGLKEEGALAILYTKGYCSATT